MATPFVKKKTDSLFQQIILYQTFIIAIVGHDILRHIVSNPHTKTNTYLLYPFPFPFPRGFMDAFRSVRGALLQVVHSLLILPPSVLAEDYGIKIDENEDENGEKKELKKAVKVDDSNIADHWHIYVTGHSLGGALATLFSFELGRIRAGNAAQYVFYLTSLHNRVY
jgi:Lipase (class 3)